MTTYRALDLVYGFTSIISCRVVVLQSPFIITLKAVLNLQKRNTMSINKYSRKIFWFLGQINSHIWPMVVSLMYDN
jgi:hypothetical protein